MRGRSTSPAAAGHRPSLSKRRTLAAFPKAPSFSCAWMLRGRKTKHWMRSLYALQSFWKLKRSAVRAFSYRDFLQAGKSVHGIHSVEPTGAIIHRFAAAAAASVPPRAAVPLAG